MSYNVSENNVTVLKCMHYLINVPAENNAISYIFLDRLICIQRDTLYLSLKQCRNDKGVCIDIKINVSEVSWINLHFTAPRKIFLQNFKIWMNSIIIKVINSVN